MIRLTTMRMSKLATVSAIALALAGCANTRLVPRDGPEPTSVRASAAVKVGDQNTALPYVLVDLDPRTVAAQAASGGGSTRGGSLAGRGRGGGDVRPGVGDLVGVTIYESGSGGLFSGSTAAGELTGGSNRTELPNQTVDSRGNITVPYAGQIRASGRSIPDIQAAIVERLRDRAIEPQVIVTLQEQRSSVISVMGDVGAPGVYPLPATGGRVLDAIAKAGGNKYPAFETLVYLQRKGSRSQVDLQRLLQNPSENVGVAPGDTIFLSREPRSFIVLGAVGTSSRVDFDRPAMTLADAVAKSGGLLDTRADAGAVLVYRFEEAEVLHRMGVDTARFGGTRVPVLYKANLNSPTSFFLAKQFQLQNDDVVFATNALGNEIRKFFELVRSVTGPARDVISIRNLVQQETKASVSVGID